MQATDNSPAIASLHALFPEAISNEELVHKVHCILEHHDYSEENTLFASALCCDEVNRVLEHDFSAVYGDHFSMGGLAGFPFGGTTAFGAMSHHIPEDGACLIVYGPHVGFDNDGQIGKLHRRGHRHSDACCGSACAALGYVQKVSQGLVEEAPMPMEDPIEMQQWMVGNCLLNHKERLEQSANPNAELPMALFDEQVKLMHDIIQKGCKNMTQSERMCRNSKITLLGGIQINMPKGHSDYFVPLKFEVYNNAGEMFEDHLEELTTCEE